MNPYILTLMTKCYLEFFKNLDKIANIDDRYERYEELDQEFEADFNQLVTFAKNHGWKFSVENQVSLASRIKEIYGYREKLFQKMINDVERM